MAAGTTAVTTGLTALGTVAVKSYADFEQLKGGIETLFGTGGKGLQEYAKSVEKTTAEVETQYNQLIIAQNKAMDNSAKAYKTAGLSANAYMEVVTGMAAALKQSTGSELEAAKAADQAIIDMSDNANKMGTSMELIQNAYQGFSKQNYTMLDNLKLGYGGTKEEMQRLLADAEKLSGVKYDISSLSDVYEAIHVVQTELGITGTTALEAATTISGSANMMKAAWSNLLVGMSDSSQDFNVLIGNLVDSVVVFADNLIPKIAETAPRLVDGLASLFTGLAPQIPGMMEPLIQAVISGTEGISRAIREAVTSANFIESGMGIVTSIITGIASAATDLAIAGLSLITTLAQGIAQGVPEIIPSISEMLLGISEAIVEYLPQIIQSGIEIILAIIEGIASMLPTLALQAVELISQLSVTLLDNLPRLIEVGILVLQSLLEGILDALPTLISKVAEIVPKVITVLNKAQPMLLRGAIQLFMALVDALPQIIDALVDNIPTIITALVEGLAENTAQVLEAAIILFMALIEAIPEIVVELTKALPQIITAVVEGLSTAIPNVFEAAKELFGSILNAIPEIVSGVTAAVPEIIDGIVNGLADGVSAVWEGIKTLGNSIIEGFKEVLGIHSPSVIMQELGRFLVEGLLNGLIELPDRVMEIFTTILSNITQWGTELVTSGVQIATNFVNQCAELIGQLPGRIAEFLNKIIADVIVWASDMLINAQKAATDFISTTSNIIATLPGKIAGFLSTIIANVIKWAADMLSNGQKAGNDFVTKVVEYISQLPGKIQGFINQIISTITTFVTNMGNKAAEAGRGFYDRIVGALSGLPGKMTEIGSNIISGIWNGISSGWSWLTGKVSELANSLFDAAKRALDINSPSRKFKWIAEMCVAGWDEGAEGLMDPDIMTRNVKAGLASMQAAVSVQSNGKIGDSNTINQTININKELATADEMARAIRIESRYGLMRGVPVGT